MFYVYILTSDKFPDKHYIGLTNNVERRLQEHNLKPSCSYTIKYKPWKLKNFIAFDNENKARKFELYLKSHSGRAFANKHF